VKVAQKWIPMMQVVNDLYHLNCQSHDCCLHLSSKHVFIKQTHQESRNEVDQLHTWMASAILSKQQKPEDIVSRMIT